MISRFCVCRRFDHKTQKWLFDMKECSKNKMSLIFWLQICMINSWFSILRKKSKGWDFWLIFFVLNVFFRFSQCSRFFKRFKIFEIFSRTIYIYIFIFSKCSTFSDFRIFRRNKINCAYIEYRKCVIFGYIDVWRQYICSLYFHFCKLYDDLIVRALRI